MTGARPCRPWQCLQRHTLRSLGPALATDPKVGLSVLTVSSQVDRERPHSLLSGLLEWLPHAETESFGYPAGCLTRTVGLAVCKAQFCKLLLRATSLVWLTALLFPSYPRIRPVKAS